MSFIDGAKTTAKGAAKSTFHSIITWDWTKQLLYWIIISAGTMSECVFLVASLWMSINSSVHPLVRLAMTEDMTGRVSDFATAAYVALPECILGLAFVTVIGHLRIWLYNKSTSAAIWTVLYGVPTIVFLVLSLITLGNSVASNHFIMPEPLVVIRALAGYMFAFTSLLHAQLGVPQERDRMKQKDESLAALRQENATNLATLKKENDESVALLQKEMKSLQETIKNQNEEIEKSKQHLAQSKNAQSELQKAMDKSEDAALQAYSEECIKWLKSGSKTVSLEEISRYTGHSKRKIEGAITKGYLQLASRNKELILMSSLVPWLKSVQPSTGKTEEIPMLHIVNG